MAAGIDLNAIRRVGRRMVGFSDELAGEVKQMQDFLLHEVYLHPKSADKVRQSEQIIGELFAALRQDPSLLPPRYRQRADSEGLPRVVCDYIAGMTDRYCRLEHERVRGT